MSKQEEIKRKKKQQQRRSKSKGTDTVDTSSFNQLSPHWQDFYRLVIEKIN